VGGGGGGWWARRQGPLGSSLGRVAGEGPGFSLASPEIGLTSFYLRVGGPWGGGRRGEEAGPTKGDSTQAGLRAARFPPPSVREGGERVVFATNWSGGAPWSRTARGRASWSLQGRGIRGRGRKKAVKWGGVGAGGLGGGGGGRSRGGRGEGGVGKGGVVGGGRPGYWGRGGGGLGKGGGEGGGGGGGEGCLGG